MELKHKVTLCSEEKLTADLVGEAVNTVAKPFGAANKAGKSKSKSSVVTQGTHCAAVDAKNNSAKVLDDFAKLLKRAKKAIDKVENCMSGIQSSDLNAPCAASNGGKDGVISAAEVHTHSNLNLPQVDVVLQETTEGIKFIFTFKNVKTFQCGKCENPFNYVFENGVLTVAT